VVGLYLGNRVGSQSIGPTIEIIVCKVVDHSIVLLGGVSTSPPNPTGIGGEGTNHYSLPSKTLGSSAMLAE
jgi:hypothetical protein